MGIISLALIAVLYAATLFATLMRRDWSGALMMFGSLVFTVGTIWKFYEDV